MIYCLKVLFYFQWNSTSLYFLVLGSKNFCIKLKYFVQRNNDLGLLNIDSYKCVFVGWNLLMSHKVNGAIKEMKNDYKCAIKEMKNDSKSWRLSISRTKVNVERCVVIIGWLFKWPLVTWTWKKTAFRRLSPKIWACLKSNRKNIAKTGITSLFIWSGSMWIFSFPSRDHQGDPTELRGIPEESFQHYIETWQRRMRKCIRLEEDYFEEEIM